LLERNEAGLDTWIRPVLGRFYHRAILRDLAFPGNFH
jgi:hypothetical protein